MSFGHDFICTRIPNNDPFAVLASGPTPLETVRRAAASVDWNTTAMSLGFIAAGALVGWLAAILLLRGLARWAKNTPDV